jgi:hypothetical protein
MLSPRIGLTRAEDQVSRTRPQFTKAQIRRAVKGAESAGLRVRRITINPDGSITVDITVDAGEIAQDVVDNRNSGLAASWDDFR